MAVKHQLHNDARTRARLRGGRPGDGDAAQLKRNRVLAAVIDVVEEVGYARMTVARVIAGARTRHMLLELPGVAGQDVDG